MLCLCWTAGRIAVQSPQAEVAIDKVEPCRTVRPVGRSRACPEGSVEPGFAGTRVPLSSLLAILERGLPSGNTWTGSLGSRRGRYRRCWSTRSRAWTARKSSMRVLFDRGNSCAASGRSPRGCRRYGSRQSMVGTKQRRVAGPCRSRRPSGSDTHRSEHSIPAEPEPQRVGRRSPAVQQVAQGSPEDRRNLGCRLMGWNPAI